jgi:tRNA threonylcarbamoyladenosine biosynthesis protein TsaB
MILAIDTSEKKCMVEIFDGRKIDQLSWPWQKDTGSEVLERIKKILLKHSLKLSEVEAIAVNQGPGSYTGVRVGITVANTLSWSLDIPVIGYNAGNIEKMLAKITDDLKNRKISPPRFPTPIYQ